MHRRLDAKLYFKSRAFLRVLIIALLFTFFIITYCAINNIVIEQNQIQQKSVTPVFELVQQDLLKPLYLAESFAKSAVFENALKQPDVSESVIVDKLKALEEQFGLTVFLALEASRKQYMSDGRIFDIEEGKVYWYFEAMQEDKRIMADLGQAGNIHVFFDVKMVDKNQNFLGYIGVGKPVRTFLEAFDKLKKQYGYDFIFVDDNSEIVLTSFADLLKVDESAPCLADLDAFSGNLMGVEDLDGQSVFMRSEEYMISQIPIRELAWRLLLLTPMEKRKATITQTLLVNAFMTFAVVASILAVTYAFLLQYKFFLERSSLVEPLTGLPNRTFLQRHYLKLRKQQAMLCVVVCDLDRFKLINDTHGHNAGDAVIKHTAMLLKDHFRQDDVVCRWGGEEFVILAPSKSSHLGMLIAERARKELEKTCVCVSDKSITFTASFGVCFGSSETPLDKLIGLADAALYQAKAQGRNCVVTKDYYEN